jgi:uncharacterized membrane protein YdjX (TVP38/TMEM64 family)
MTNVAIWLLFLLLVTFLVASWARQGIVFDLLRQDLVADEKRKVLQQAFGSLGPLAPVAYLSMVTIEVVVAPIPGLMLYAPGGVVFGVWLGGALALAGNTLGAGIACKLARTLRPRWMEQSLSSPNAARLTERLQHHGGWIIFFLRLNPLTSSDVVSYAAGFTSIRITTVMLATCLGMAPLCFAQAWLASEVLTFAPKLLYVMLLALLLYLFAVAIAVHRLVNPTKATPSDSSVP